MSIELKTHAVSTQLTGTSVRHWPQTGRKAQAAPFVFKWPHVLPHEWIFGTFLLLTGLRLFMRGGEARVWSLVFLGCLLGGMAVISWAAQNPTPLRWRI